MKFLKKFIEISNQKIYIFNNLHKEDQEANKFLLRTSLSDLVYFTSYSIYQIGKELKIGVLPTDSIESKFKKITYWEENFFTKEEKDFIQSIIKYRHKLAHNDTYFPDLKSVKSMFIQFERKISSIVDNVVTYNRSLNAMQNRIRELKDLLNKVKILLTQKKIELFNEYKTQIELTEKLAQSIQENVEIRRKNVYEIFKKIKKYFPYTLDFLNIILKYDLHLLNNPVDLFNKYFKENTLCPQCGSNSYTDNFFLCNYYYTEEAIKIQSFKPFNTTKIRSNLFVVPDFCDNWWEEVCYNCHMGEEIQEIEPPKHSIYCENCGFYYLVGDRAGYVPDFY